MKKWKVILLVCTALSAFGFFYGWQEFTRKHKSSRTLKTDYVIDATELYDAFNKDEAAATKQYTDKVLEVKGTIKEVSKFNGAKHILLNSSNDAGGILCQFEDDVSDRFETMEAGQPVRIKGICTGFLYDVVISRCVIK
ncbi:MAG: hypothetical protein SFU21_14165 [Flavihumibacter sp.]|nr:hypothetical protein [Flavihumibacter sp.]